METFEKVVIIVALIILIISLAIIGTSLKKGDYKKPDPTACPDFWYSGNYAPCQFTDNKCCPDGVTTAINPQGSNCNNGSCLNTQYGCCPDGVTPANGDNYVGCPVGKAGCYNTKKLGICTTAPDFSKAPYLGTDSLCKKQMWAKGCKISWDGVTNVPDTC